MTVHGIRRSAAPVAGLDRQGTLDDLADFLPEADFVVLAVPNTDETAGMIGAGALARMKPSATLVNVGRGALVDIEALTGRARHGRAIAQAFVDVLPTEPLARRQRPLGHPQPLHLPPRRLHDAALHRRASARSGWRT